MKILLFAFAILYTQFVFAQGTIRGRVTDAETGEEMIGTNVLIKGTSTGTTTDLDGNFTISNVETGTYDLEASFISYEKKTITGVEVKDGEVTVIDFNLGEASLEVSEVVVEAKKVRNTESAVITLQRKSSSILDGISSAQIAKNGDSDAAAAVSRVTGVSVEQGKYVYIRGLGDRYSKTLLNGAELPGLDPNRNSVQMDLFPSNTLDNLLVYKTFSPDLPASFTGGLLNVVTKDFPEKFNLQFSTSLGYNTNSSFNKNFMTYEGGSLDALGIDDGSRDVPEAALNDLQAYGIGMSEEEANRLRAATESFDNNMDFSRQRSFMDHSHSLALGNQSRLFNRPIGYNISLSYKRSFDYYDNGESGRYVLIDDYDRTRRLNADLSLSDEASTESVLWGGMFNTNYKINSNNKIGATVLYNQSADKTARFQQGRKLIDDPRLRYQTRSLTFLERSIFAAQLKGEHLLKNLNNTTVDWVSSYTVSSQDEPDMRFFTSGFRVNNGDTLHSIEPSVSQLPTRYYREMQEMNVDNKLNITVPFNQWGGQKSKFKFGGSYVYKNRDFREDQYRFARQTNAYSGDPDTHLAADSLFGPENDKGVYAQTAFEAKNNYDAYEKTAGAYVMVDMPLVSTLKFSGGVRMEHTDILLESFDEDVENGELNNTDFLPSANFNYGLSEKMNLRASYNRTLARPTFRELAPFASFSFIGDFILLGNADLQRTLIDNVDLRWEMYPNPGEIFSASVFYKDFKNPIERAFNPLAPNSDELNYRNVDRAQLIGVELEFRKNLNFISEALQDLSLGGNFTYVYSRVDIAEDELANIRNLNPEAESTRPMFGQSPYIINAFINYDNDKTGTNVNMAFNIFGPRLAVVIPSATPNVYEKPRPSLNFSISQNIGKHFALSLNANNLIDPDYALVYTFKDTEYAYQSYNIGRTFSLGFTYFIK
ncbi:MAG: TonB-dependent receptor [Chitinophagales bacterium]